MQESKKKEKWIKPELIILIRDSRRESVLAVCKGHFGHWGPEGEYDACTASEVTGTDCYDITIS